MQNDWAYNELWRTPVWDTRCRTTLVLACQQLAEQAQVSFSRALSSRRKAVSHILHHKQTTATDLLSGHVRATALRCQAEPLVLIASDTTTCDFTTHKAVTGLGPITDKEYQQGFFVHSALALSTQGVPLGLLHQQSWARAPESFGTAKLETAKQRRQRPFADKESYKWMTALRAVETALPATQKALLIQDREADIFAFFAAPRRPGLDLLIRATQPRRLLGTAESQTSDNLTSDSLTFAPNVLAIVAQAPIVGSRSVAVRARPDREAREAHLQVRLTRVSIAAPCHEINPPAASVSAWVICACEQPLEKQPLEKQPLEKQPLEKQPLEKQPLEKQPLEWVLLCTLPEVDADLALRLVGYYALRWRIERFHFVLKSGCGYEKLQMDTAAVLQKALSLYSVVAWRLLFFTYAATEKPDLPVEAVLSPVEKEVLERSRGKPLLTVQEALLAVAELAGFVWVCLGSFGPAPRREKPLAGVPQIAGCRRWIYARPPIPLCSPANPLPRPIKGQDKPPRLGESGRTRIGKDSEKSRKSPPYFSPVLFLPGFPKLGAEGPLGRFLYSLSE